MPPPPLFLPPTVPKLPLPLLLPNPTLHLIPNLTNPEPTPHFNASHPHPKNPLLHLLVLSISIDSPDKIKLRWDFQREDRWEGCPYFLRILRMSLGVSGPDIWHLERDWRREGGAEGDAVAGRLEERKVCFAEADVEGVVDIKVLMFVGVVGEALSVGAGVSQVVQYANANMRMEKGVGVVAVSTAAKPTVTASVFAFATTPTSMSSAFFPALFSAGALALFMPAYSCGAGIGDSTKDELKFGNGECLARYGGGACLSLCPRCAVSPPLPLIGASTTMQMLLMAS
ncbi:hypothetical protein M422DRAFT_268133 [Sphaerobolus stellatus SS14]|uniref:Uncharacterized protein n=1 Tax=Sphaerobolus stellatus (strain SS14) TaxID=990650 RepID=A0A0C9UYB6_SPHS4|nr:hypothetical protein M422DRAFT_268133 [Sphaerobolus stellatus SS14]